MSEVATSTSSSSPDAPPGIRSWLQTRAASTALLFALAGLALTDDVLYGELSITEELLEQLGWQTGAFVIMIELIVPTAGLIAWIFHRHSTLRWLVMWQATWMTLAQVNYVSTLVVNLARYTTGIVVLNDALLVLLSNVGVFAVWYWVLDGGGPDRRDSSGGQADLVFALDLQPSRSPWRPSFVDYLYASFLTTVTCSAGDTLLATTRVKLLGMLQAALGLAVILLITARAVNILS